MGSKALFLTCIAVFMAVMITTEVAAREMVEENSIPFEEQKMTKPAPGVVESKHHRWGWGGYGGYPWGGYGGYGGGYGGYPWGGYGGGYGRGWGYGGGYGGGYDGGYRANVREANEP
ncbi:OLC1v1018905C1 [Oldenlandia corymbosa var. corymbosa]|uniref:OLC1v1018905C1 n=1 Tax=Oldenlandia corymbosa var. corymbosa TaxID=529605 RepID=A0AAV1ECW5_OLDCO|nr:OLC1v1018905C1 [Oldenlandia corymbosa var. corymbosa]